MVAVMAADEHSGELYERMVALCDQYHCLRAELMEVAGVFGARRLFEADHATSLTAWLRGRDFTASDAARIARMGARLRELPVTAEAMRTGALRSGQVQAVVANLSKDTAPLFAEAEAEMVPRLVELDVADAAYVMREWAQAARDHLDRTRPPKPEPAREEQDRCHFSSVLDGRWQLDADLGPESGAIVHRALTLAAGDDPTRVLSERYGDALVDVCRFFLNNQTTKNGGRHRPHLNVVAGLGDLQHGGTAEIIDDGQPTIIGHRTARKLACDSILHRLLIDERGRLLDYGRATRSTPPPLWNALVIRDGHCRFPGCDRQSNWCEGHHEPHWLDGAETKLEHLMLLCSKHHHLVHQPGWTVILEPDGTAHFTDPTGRIRTTQPPGLQRFTT